MRTRRMPRLIAGVMVLSLLAGPLLALPAPAQANHSANHMMAQVEVSYRGYNGETEWEIEVEQGQEVEITFVWADHAVPDNAHRMLIEGYDLRSELIDVDNPETTISFIADKPGTFTIICDWRCEGHDELEGGRLRVTGGDARDPDIAPAEMALATYDPSPGGALRVELQMNDTEGAFIADAPVRFFLQAAFAGAEGEMEIGQVRTDEHGTATFTYRPTRTGEQQMIARFEGHGLHGPTEQVIDFSAETAAPAYEAESMGIQPIRAGAPYFAALLVVAIWATFAYALFQTVRIRDDRA